MERRAGEPFRTVGLDVVADDDPPGVAELTAAVDAHHVLVVDGAGDGFTHLVAWLWVGLADGDLLIEQVSVDPSCRGRRLGTRLIALAVEHARARGFPGVCLTSFVDVPWNGPLYRSLGFLPLDASDLRPDLRPDLHAVRAAEQDAGLDVAPRAAFRLPLR
ncbi:GNAT family N-acetyltransferase [Corynebacterium sp. AOP34-AQ2-28]|uniref:GNAT family N-acetyltransferase n=1 Tax=unclassified Corynebacterium TaxID=2624378 RepID=UPI002647E12A|nr:GNAT family N-acetyltransferase [Corynebacterium sp.]MDN5582421.1 GNAT family N-acetyltransferase [Corynebacterium sp.]MDN5719647.1 GNAT family N-acetyltransferase [Corynebacterium sp.]MDN6510670.1 GNAT family N-acetyltransferase [Corynebacterium sp.]